jgi:hypothetical protein
MLRGNHIYATLKLNLTLRKQLKYYFNYHKVFAIYVALPSYTSFSPLQSHETIPLGTAAYIEPTWTRVRRGPCSGGGRCCGR